MFTLYHSLNRQFQLEYERKYSMINKILQRDVDDVDKCLGNLFLLSMNRMSVIIVQLDLSYVILFLLYTYALMKVSLANQVGSIGMLLFNHVMNGRVVVIVDL